MTTPHTANPDQLLTYPQAAQRLGDSTRDVQRMVRLSRSALCSTRRAGAVSGRRCRLFRKGGPHAQSRRRIHPRVDVMSSPRNLAIRGAHPDEVSGRTR